MPWLCVEISVQWPLTAPPILSLLVRFVPLSCRNLQCLEISLQDLGLLEVTYILLYFFTRELLLAQLGKDGTAMSLLQIDLY